MRLNFIDAFLDKLTMYQLLWWYLRILIAIAVILAFLGKLPFSPWAILVSTLVIVAVAWGTNELCAKVFKAVANVESSYITGLILALIISPTLSLKDMPFLIIAAVVAMASKYILAIGKKHIFNPAAIAVVISAFAFHQYASWWVGTLWMLPFVTVGGILVVRKIQRSDLVLCFFVSALAVYFIFSLQNGSDFLQVLRGFFLDSSAVFFATIMLTEPLTTPPTKNLQIVYGILSGLLYNSMLHIGTVYSSPELDLVLVNIFTYLVSPKTKLMLHVKEKIQVGFTQIDFVFQPTKKIAFQPGQYMEWTLGYKKPDARGNRRYFTIASSPTEENIRLGVKFYENGSTFKKHLQDLTDKTPLVASQIAGDFTLPKDKKRKLVFIAGGIGITPYRSMMKYLIDMQEKRNIILFYSNKTQDEIMYQDIFKEAEKMLGIPTIYTLTDERNIPKNWQGEKGRINAAMLKKYLPDWKERYFYLSGPHMMVDAYEHILHKIGVPGSQIKKDFFPGFV